MCEAHSGELNLGPYPSHPTNTYICGAINAPRMCGGMWQNIMKSIES